jgi:hypothetical protein
MSKDLFIEMLRNTNTKHTILKDTAELIVYKHKLPTAQTIVHVENTRNELNASKYCYSYWIFDKEQKFLGVYHYEC